MKRRWQWRLAAVLAAVAVVKVKVVVGDIRAVVPMKIVAVDNDMEMDTDVVIVVHETFVPAAAAAF